MDIYSVKAAIKSVIFKLQNLRAQRHAVIFVGDSLTARCDLNKFYPKYGTLNRGISGDALANLARRMDLSVYDLCPRAIVFLMGINDIAFNGLSDDDLLDLYDKTFAEWRKRYATIPIIVQSLYPAADDERAEYNLPKGINDRIVKINAKLKTLCQKYGLGFADIHSLLLKDGRLNRELACDCLHLNEKGYKIVSDEIGRLLDEHLSDSIDIYSKGEYPSDALSNFYAHSFVLDGRNYASMEGFLQSLKVKNAAKASKICALSGAKAKAAGKRHSLWKLTKTLYYNGKPIKRDSAEFDSLITKAYDALFENEKFKAALKGSENKLLEHSVGKDDKRKTVLTRNEFLAQLYRLRNKLES